jgi:hypothetical protein
MAQYIVHVVLYTVDWSHTGCFIEAFTEAEILRELSILC